MNRLKMARIDEANAVVVLLEWPKRHPVRSKIPRSKVQGPRATGGDIWAKGNEAQQRTRQAGSADDICQVNQKEKTNDRKGWEKDKRAKYAAPSARLWRRNLGPGKRSERMSQYVE